jgi:hypothetical protein
MKKYLVHIIWLVVAIIALIGGIFYGKGSASGQAAARSYASSTRSGASRTGASGGFVSGQIISVGADSMTVSLANGNSQVVFYSSSTQVMKPTIVPASDLTSGTRVMIGGTANSDGSLTAQSIQVQTGNGFAGGTESASGSRQFGTGSAVGQ